VAHLNAEGQLCYERSATSLIDLGTEVWMDQLMQEVNELSLIINRLYIEHSRGPE
jgi:hypothetical protein